MACCREYSQHNLLDTLLNFAAMQRQKAIVTPSWLHQSIQNGHPVECGTFAAIRELHDDTVENCPTDEAHVSDASPAIERTTDLRPAYTEPKVKPTDPRVFKNWAAKYACQRASPLVCVNQALAMELNVLTKSRELEGLSMNALSYEKTVGVCSILFTRVPVLNQRTTCVCRS